MKQLGSEADRLCDTHPEQAEDIRGKQDEIEQNWEKLRVKAAERKQRLDDSYYLHRLETFSEI